MTPLDDLLCQEALDIHFQPIISLKQKTVVGLEALARPRTMNVGEMFKQAALAGHLLEVDRLCRRKAMEAYRALAKPRPLLFLNFETSIIDDGIVGSGAILSLTQSAGLNPSDIVIEINESKVADIAALKRFVEHHRSLGFLIALDDLGAGHSNLPRIIQLRPHIIKLDRELIDGIDGDFLKQETMRSLVGLCKSIGSLVLAEGVETLAEVDTCTTLGAEFFQGYYFSRPQAPLTLDFAAIQPSMLAAANRLRSAAVRAMRARRLESNRIQYLLEKGRKLLLQSEPERFDTALANLVRRDLSLEASYLLDQNGIQVGNTQLGQEVSVSRSHLFAPTSHGADHASKEYFFSLLDGGLERYITEPYISIATGNLCRTVSVVLCHPIVGKCVLCIDLKARSAACRAVAGGASNCFVNSRRLIGGNK